MSLWGPAPDLNTTKTVVLACNLAQTAGTYTAGTATGDVLVTNIAVFSATASTGLTSITISTDNTTADVILASTLLAVLTGGKNLGAVTTPFVLPTTKHITYTIVGIGSAGLVNLACVYRPLASGAVLA